MLNTELLFLNFLSDRFFTRGGVVAEACAFLAAIAAAGEHAGSAVAILLLFLVISLNGIAMRLTSQRGLLRDLARAGDVKEYLALNMDGRDDEANA